MAIRKHPFLKLEQTQPGTFRRRRRRRRGGGRDGRRRGRRLQEGVLGVLRQLVQIRTWAENKEPNRCTNMKYRRNIKSFRNVDISEISNLARISKKTV